MKENVIINGQIILAEVTTTQQEISFKTNELDIQTVLNEFREVTSLQVAAEGSDEPYGIYEHLYFSSVKADNENNVTVEFNMESDVEKRLKALEDGQETQDGAIEELAGMIGGAE